MTALEKSVQKFLEANRISLKKKRLLLACSGGLDSMVLCELLHRMELDFALAHCNFQLRGTESDKDEQLVAVTAKRLNVKFYAQRFDTKSYSEEKKISTQMAARELRYSWFETVRIREKFDYIVTAHHLNDNIETVLFNFLKGTGINGLKGIKVRKGKLLRPLLSIKREELEAFQKEDNIAFREDESNASNVYTRNKIRLELMPVIKEINPGFEETFADRIKVMNDLSEIYEKKIAKDHQQLFLNRGREIFIPLLKLKKIPNLRSVLFEFLKKYEFNASQVDDILGALNATSGKQFLTSKARLIKDRQFLVLTENAIQEASFFLLEKGSSSIQVSNGKLEWKAVESESGNIKADKNRAFIDAGELTFPLTLRHWKKGDYFYPFGMQRKKKKLSKYFKDQKLRIDEKEQVWVLESDKRIVWVVNERIDERFRLTDKTRDVLQLKWVADK